MKMLWWIIGGIAIATSLVLVVLLRPMTPTTSTQTDTSTPASQPMAVEPTSEELTSVISSGRYVDYSADLIDDDGFQTTILFFYAGWCPECRGYDMAIKASAIPDGTQLLKVDYDTSQDLRQKYGVTIQSSFVRVNSVGEKQVLWSGYGREKTLEAIIENTK